MGDGDAATAAYNAAISATIIDGRAIAAAINDEVAREVDALRGAGHAPPALHVVLCGDDAASATYVRNKGKVAARIGVAFVLHTPLATTSTAEMVALVAGLSADPDVDAILVQLPLPAQIDEAAVMAALEPGKDADGFHPFNFGMLAAGHPGVSLPCTPAGCMEMLHRQGVELSGATAVVVGRSTIVGRPMAMLLTAADATVTVCHSRTRDLPDVCRTADILVVAMGRPGMIDATYIKPGACVIDVGITPTPSGVTGDVDAASVAPVAGMLTPVPGGVGPMTIAMLMRNTLRLAQAHRRLAGEVTA